MRFSPALAAAILAPLLAACGHDGPPPPDPREVLQGRCFDLGGSYFEYEATSAGAHVWCIKPDGAEIRLDGGE